MKQNDFYEVNGCTEFIPVTINETYTDRVDVTVHGPIRPFRTTVEQVYQFQKPHEPQKVVLPKHVAEWIEEHKAQFSNLYTVYSWLGQQKNKVSEWVNSNIDIFARAWLDGYEIEQEKLYEVTVPGTSNYKNQRQHLVKQGKHWFFCGNEEIKEDFDWAWQFREEVD